MIDRRKFLELSSSAATAVMLSSLESFSTTHKPAFKMNKDFELKIMATNWGFNGSLDEFCAKAAKEGYDGIEVWWPSEKKPRTNYLLH